MNEEKEYNKFKSRTFWLTIIWTAFVPLSVVLQIFTNVVLPLEKMVEISGLLTITYVGGNKLYNTMKDKK